MHFLAALHRLNLPTFIPTTEQTLKELTSNYLTACWMQMHKPGTLVIYRISSFWRISESRSQISKISFKECYRHPTVKIWINDNTIAARVDEMLYSPTLVTPPVDPNDYRAFVIWWFFNWPPLRGYSGS